jgi:tyrosyl-tRNA synthetase
MDKVDELLTRGIANVIPSRDELKKKLSSKDKLNIYLGIDPTATKIHLGHAVSLRVLQKLADLGHNVTFLIGDFTALVGDTSDKESERPALTKEEIEENFQTYKAQAEKILDFSKVKVRHNSEWLSNLSFEEIIKLFREFSLGDFIGRELIAKRMSEGKRVRLDEVIYPVMQGYDSYFMDTDIQVGGTDQTYNMQAGRTLIKSLRNKDSFILAVDFLMGTDGRKMSKSWGNAIWLTDEPFEMYRKVMAINDDQIKNYFLLGTNLPNEEIPSEEEIKNDPMSAKKSLARTIVTELHGEDEAKLAADQFQRTVQNKELPTEIPERTIKADTLVDENFLVDIGFAASRSDAKRLFNQDAVSLDSVKIRAGEAIADETGEGLILSVGKKMLKLKIE